MFKVPLTQNRGRNRKGWNVIEGVYEPVGSRRVFPNTYIESLGRNSTVFVYTEETSQYKGRHRILVNLTGEVDPVFVPYFPGQTYLNTFSGILWEANTFTFPPGLTESSWNSEGEGS